MAAGNSKTDIAFLFNPDSGIDLFIPERLNHIITAGIGISTIIFAQMASQAPFFVYINPFHRLFPRVLNAQNFELFFIQAYAPEHQAVSF